MKDEIRAQTDRSNTLHRKGQGLSLGLFFLLAVLFPGVSAAVTDRPLHPLNGVPFVKPENAGFSFAVVGDFRPAQRDQPYPAVFLRIVDELVLIAPSLVIDTGDSYYGYGGSFQGFKSEIDHFLAMTRRFEMPLFSAFGNHDLTGDNARADYVRDLFGRLYGSFDFDGAHFIILDAEELNAGGQKAEEQMQWLADDLGENGSAAVFVALHRPVFPTIAFAPRGTSLKKSVRSRLHELFVRYRVKAVFAGHEHLFDDEVRDGVRYVISGGGGAPLVPLPVSRAYFHYVLVTVKGGEISMAVMRPGDIKTRNLAGDDGLVRKAEKEITNSTNRDIMIRGLSFMMPSTNVENYRVTASWDGHSHGARIRNVKVLQNGTSSVTVETLLPRQSTIRISVEAEK